MKIALVSLEYPPFGGGGIGTYTRAAARALAGAGHQVHVIANAWGDLPRTEEDVVEGLWVHRVDALASDYSPRFSREETDPPHGLLARFWEISLFWSAMAADKLSEVHKKFALDVVEFPECFGEGFTAMRKKELGMDFQGLPLVCTLHMPTDIVMRQNVIRTHRAWFERRKALEFFCIRQADGLAAPSRAMLERVLGKEGQWGNRPVSVIRNPLDMPGPLNGETDQGGDPFFLFAGRLEPRKGVKLFVDAAAQVLEKHPGLRVRLVGKDGQAGEAAGPMSEFLRSRVPSHLLDRFDFEPLVARENLFRLYRRARACVFASDWDNFPYTLAEAMASGGSVVAARAGGMAEMVEHEKSGLLFEAGDRQGLEACLERLLDDPGLNGKLRKNAPPRIRSLCDPERFVKKKEEFFQRAIQKAKAGKTPAPPKNRKARVSVFVFPGQAAPGMASTRKAVDISAGRAGLVLNGETGPGSRDSNVFSWLEKQNHADYLLFLNQGDLPGAEYLSTTSGILERFPQAAWATTWMRPPGPRAPAPYCGHGFTLPLELLYYHPLPFALVRRSALEEVGGLNPGLPRAWRWWDLLLTFSQAGLSGLTAPVWQARHAGRMNLEPPATPEVMERMLEAVAARNPKIFKKYGANLWISRTMNQGLAGPERSLARAQAKIHALETSWSWKITGPLRNIHERFLKKGGK